MSMMGPGRQPGGGPMGGGSPPTEKATDFRVAIRRFATRLHPERWLVGAVFVLGSVSVFLAVLGPKLLGNATNVIFAGVISARIPSGMTQEQAVAGLKASGDDQQADMVGAMTLNPGSGVDFGELARIISLVAIVYFVSALLSWAQNYLMAGVTQRTMFRLREEVDHKLGRLPLKYYDSTPRGDLLSRVTNDIDNIATTLQQTLTQLVTSILTVIGVLAMMVWISPLLAIISVLTVPLSFLVTMLIAKRSKPHFVDQWAWTGTLNAHVEETFSGHELVRVYGHRQEAIAEFDAANERMYEASYRAQFISGLIQPALTFISNLNYVAIAVFGGLRVASGTMSLGDVQAFIQYSRQFSMPIMQIAGVANMLQSGAASVERVFEILDVAEESPDSDVPVRIADPAGRISFEHVRFRYLEDVPLIEDLSLDVEPGQTIAIVGPTGAGKTTLVNLLMRFYEVQSGRILIDGVDTRDATREDVRRCFGMVLQDAWLFEGTIYDNIAYGAEDSTRSDVEQAARASFAEHFIRTLPDGYDSLLTDLAENVSSGERQLLTIARAFLANPAVLILDEATSSVDTRTEVLIQRAMADLRRGRTSFVIAHRLSTIRNADVIIVMDKGSIIEQGTHEELIAAQGFYFNLYESQFAQSPDEIVAR
jgi:ATP-binding cassette subfamily B multidrug efflux pump